ncbi:MAG: hypothetical protein ACI8YQ_004616 [Polaribacter sp.]
MSVSTSDYNLDGWPDIFVTVDHDEEEMVFKNNGDGTFKYDTKHALKQNSNSSMGVDAGDINNDKYPDFVVVEMLPKDYYREKVSMSMQSVQRFTFLTDTADYNYFQMRNFLHLNNGNGTFSDIGQLAGIHKSDWSWSCLLMDGDNDGNQDLFVANGYWRNLYNKDNKKKLDEGMLALNGDFAKMNKLASEYSKTC